MFPVLLAGCSAHVADTMPAEFGGLPVGAPERRAEPLAYPAIHDVPPDRATRVLDEDQQKRLEQDLASARDKQSGRARRARGAAQ